MSTTAMSPSTQRPSYYPGAYALQHMQSLECRWDNGVEWTPNVEGLSSLQVIVYPEAQAGWDRYEEIYGQFDPLNCFTLPNADSGYCSWDSITENGAWVEVVYDGMDAADAIGGPGSAFMTMVDSILATVSSAQVGQRWYPQARQPLPECGELLTDEVIGTALGIDPASVSINSDPIGGTSLQYEAQQASGSYPCFWIVPQLETAYGNTVDSLPGGEWAWNDARKHDTAKASASPLALTNLNSLDSAWISSSSKYGFTYTTIDLIVGGNWISFSLENGDIASLGKGEAVMTQLAQGIVDTLK